MFSQGLQGLPQASLMLLEGVWVNQYIIDEYHHKFIKVWLENPIH